MRHLTRRNRILNNGGLHYRGIEESVHEETEYISHYIIRLLFGESAYFIDKNRA